MRRPSSPQAPIGETENRFAGGNECTAAPLSLDVLLFGVGAGQTGYLAFNMSLLQSHAIDDMRGLAISFYYLNRGLAPVGTVLAGITADLVGVQWTVMVMGLVVALLGLFTLLRSPSMTTIA